MSYCEPAFRQYAAAFDGTERDFSEVEDPDPLTPLTFPGKVPNFTAKMHAILSRPDLFDIVAWMPHGRAWRILKPREFEVRVIVSLPAFQSTCLCPHPP